MIYSKNCSKCKKKTPHREQYASRIRGIRLMCLNCGTLQKNYVKVKDLVKYHIEEFT